MTWLSKCVLVVAMNNKKLDDIRSRCNAATQGPWRVSDAHGLCIQTHDREKAVADFSPSSSDPNWEGRREDAEFISSARTDVILLLNELERRTEIIEELLEYAENKASHEGLVGGFYSTDLGRVAAGIVYPKLEVDEDGH